MYKLCHYCEHVPFNREDYEWGGRIDKPDGSRGWACYACFSRNYYPQPEWSVPHWALRMVRSRTPHQCRERLREILFGIATNYRYYREVDINAKIAKHLWANINYRTAALRVMEELPDDPGSVHASIPSLERLLGERGKMQRVTGNHFHEYIQKDDHHHPWEALSIARAIVGVYGRCLWEWEKESNLWTASFGLWKLSVTLEGDTWTWKAEFPDRLASQGASFNGTEHLEHLAKDEAERKARVTLLG